MRPVICTDFIGMPALAELTCSEEFRQFDENLGKGVVCELSRRVGSAAAAMFRETIHQRFSVGAVEFDPNLP